MAKDEITPIRRDIILLLADCNMRITSVANKMHMSNSTVLYHVKMIKAITGKNPMNFYDLAELVQMEKSAYTHIPSLEEARKAEAGSCSKCVYVGGASYCEVSGKQLHPLFLDQQGRCLRKCKKGDWQDGTD